MIDVLRMEKDGRKARKVRYKLCEQYEDILRVQLHHRIHTAVYVLESGTGRDCAQSDGHGDSSGRIVQTA